MQRNDGWLITLCPFNLLNLLTLPLHCLVLYVNLEKKDDVEFKKKNATNENEKLNNLFSILFCPLFCVPFNEAKLGVVCDTNLNWRQLKSFYAFLLFGINNTRWLVEAWSPNIRKIAKLLIIVAKGKMFKRLQPIFHYSVVCLFCFFYNNIFVYYRRGKIIKNKNQKYYIFCYDHYVMLCCYRICID